MRFAVPQDAADEKADRDTRAKLGQGKPYEGGVLRHHEFGKLHPAVTEGVDLGGGGEAQHPVDLLRHRKLGVDGKREVHILSHQTDKLAVFRVTDARDRVSCTKLVCNGAAKDIDLVPRRDGDQEVGVLCPRAAEDRNVRPVPLDGNNVGDVRKLPQHVGVGIHYRQVVSLGGQLFTDREADGAGAYHDNLHVSCSLHRRFFVFPIVSPF